jgi:hypothetical protein
VQPGSGQHLGNPHLAHQGQERFELLHRLPDEVWEPIHRIAG